MKNTHLLGFCGTALVGVLLVALTGCSSAGGGYGYTNPPTGASVSPSVPIVIPTPLPSASASTSVPTQVGDFAFASEVEFVRGEINGRQIALTADGTGSTAFALQSVNGFKSPVTFPYTVTIKGPVMQPNNTQQSFDASLATVTVNPATLSSLPSGSTTVALAVKASTTLPPLATVTVDLHAEGGGLKRYPTVGPYGNSGQFVFTTPGLALYAFNVQNRLNIATGSKVTASAFIQSSGLTGTGTLGITGLPSGVTATFTRPTITLPISQDGGNSLDGNVSLTVTANQELTPGTYPVRVTVTVGGVTYTSDPANLTVINPNQG